jgi:tetratricopeptide (TPR) repeat protein
MSLETIRAPTLASLVAALDGAPPVVADLSLGASRSRQLGAELLSQLGCLPAVPPAPAPAAAAAAATSFETVGYGALISAGVDAEARGARSTLESRELADAIVERLEPAQAVVVLTPRFGEALHHKDAQLLGLLAERARVVVAEANADGARADGGSATPLVALVPGIVTREVAEALGGIEDVPTLELPGGGRLVAPEARAAPGSISKLDYDRLHAIADREGWANIEAYAQVHGHNAFVDPHWLSAQAWKEFHEGDGDLALRLMRRAAECAPWPDVQWLEVQLQGLRLGLGRHAEAEHAGDPSPAYERDVRSFLCGAKGWGLVFSDEPTRAEPWLDEARALADGDEATPDHLYLLNISALSKLKAGDLDAAFELESEIERLTPNLPEPDRALEYVNSINIARLHMRSGNLGAARRYYERAFETARGARSDSDSIYFNLCLARVDERADRPAEALLGWLRAALHWLASARPDALSPRVATALLRRKPAPLEDVVEPVSAALAGQLLAAADAAGVAPAATGDPPPAFGPARGELLWAAGAPGWSVMGMASAPPLPREARSEHDGLRSLVHALLAALAPGDDELRGARALAVDSALGGEMPVTALELVHPSVRLGIDTIRFDGWTAQLDPGLRARLAAESTVALGPAVERIEVEDGAGVVTFKRSLPPRALDRDELLVVRRCAERQGQTLAALTERAAPELIRRLEDARVLSTTLTESGCSAAGFRLPSSASLPAT